MSENTVNSKSAKAAATKAAKAAEKAAAEKAREEKIAAKKATRKAALAAVNPAAVKTAVEALRACTVLVEATKHPDFIKMFNSLVNRASKAVTMTPEEKAKAKLAKKFAARKAELEKLAAELGVSL